MSVLVVDTVIMTLTNTQKALHVDIIIITSSQKFPPHVFIYLYELLMLL